MKKILQFLWFLSILNVFFLLSIKAQSYDFTENSPPPFAKRVLGEAVIKVKASYHSVPLDDLFRHLDQQIVRTKSAISFAQFLKPESLQQARSLNKSSDVSLLWQFSFDETLHSFEQIQKILNNEDWIQYIEPVFNYELLAPPFIPSDPLLGNQYYLNNVQAYNAWGVQQGSPDIVVGVVDTGVNYNHPDLSNQIYYNDAERYGLSGIDDDGNGFVDDSLGYDFGDMDTDPFDSYHYHGTTVSGMVAATPNNSIGIAGLGYQTHIMPLKVLDASGYLRNIMQAALYAAENGCKVINLSLGRIGGYLQWEQEIFNYIILEKNVAVVSAAGNTNGEWEFYPASYQYVTSVAHSVASDNRVSNGTYSTQVDLMAPGGGVWTTFNPTFMGYGINYYPVTGSSFASPLTAGAVALVMAENPDMHALQACELVRVTADNRYSLPGNAPFTEKLGYGRLNAYRAIVENSIARSLRLFDHRWSNEKGNFAAAGDTLSWIGSFVNYLNTLSSSTSIQISTNSPYATILQNEFLTGALNPLDTAVSSTTPFKIFLHDDIPSDYTLRLRLQYTDPSNGYSDYQYIDLWVNRSIIDVNFNDISAGITSLGRMGTLDETHDIGFGIHFRGEKVLEESGLILAVSPTQVSDCVQDTMGILSAQSDFSRVYLEGVGNPAITHLNPHRTKTEAVYLDTVNAPNPIGVKITQIVEGRRNEPNNQLILLRYHLENISTVSYDSVYVGYFADWNLGDGLNIAKWDMGRSFGYVYEPGIYAGVKVLGTSPRSYFAYDLTPSFGGGNIQIEDNFTESEKYFSLSQGIARTEAGLGVGGGDVAHTSGSFIRNFNPGDTTSITFAIMIGESLSGLRDISDQADLYANPSTSWSPKPHILDSLLCGEGTYAVIPTNGSLFRFYDASHPEVSVYSGNSFSITAADTSKTFLITCIDSLIESDPIQVKFGIRQASAFFSSPDSVFMGDSSIVNFIDESIDAVSWTWSFGDGHFSNLQNPIHTYSQQGSYTVQLEIEDSYGCIANFSKVIKLTQKGPIPSINSIFQTCWASPVVLQPSNGSQFRFYSNSSLTSLLHQGSTYTVLDPNLQSIFITCVDYSIESSPKHVMINRIKLKPDFITDPIADTILYEQVTFIDKTVSDKIIVRWEWDFGDGSPHVISNNAFHLYQAQGVYRVTLTVTDNSGCISSISKVFRVGKKAPKPIVPTDLTICDGELYQFKPQNGTLFKFYREENLLSPVHTGSFVELLGNPLLPEKLFVSCIDSIIESDLAVVNLHFSKAVLDIDFNRELYLFEQNSIQFSSSGNGISFLWEFGDGRTSSLPNPTIRFYKQGEYQITCTATNEFGCKTKKSKSLKVYNRAPIPIIDSQINLCVGEVVLLEPTGGSNFRFFDSEFSNVPVFVGSKYRTRRVLENTSYYIVCIDSLIESQPKKVDLVLQRPSSSFELSSDTLNLFKQDTLFAKAEGSDEYTYIWDFGTFHLSYGQEVSEVYKKTGSYDVRLITRDSYGCIDTLTKNITVIDTLIISGLPDGESFGVMLYPNPVVDYLSLTLLLQKEIPLQFILYSVNGQQIDTLSVERVSMAQYQFDFHSLSAGLYYLQIVTPDKAYSYKIIKQ